jgi:diguanylate cyclase (GGDEF)-like protein
MRDQCRRCDPLYRFGGEEFVALIVDCDYEATLAVAERVRRSIEALRVDYEEHRLCVTASVGVCWVDQGQHGDFQDLFNQADLNLYDAKRRGRNLCVTSVTPAKHPADATPTPLSAASPQVPPPTATASP